MVAPNNDYETNARNHYYDDEEDRRRHRGDWTLPSFNLMGFAYWIGTKIAEYEWYAEQRKAQRLEAAQRKAQQTREQSDGADPEKK